MLENPISLPIMKLLTEKQLSITQITKSLQDFDVKTHKVIAVLAELYHFGLVERVEVKILNTPSQNHSQSKADIDFLPEFEPLISSTPLGIPLSNYVSLWEKVIQKPDQLSSYEFNEWLFSVPKHITKKIEGLTLEEIRKKFIP